MADAIAITKADGDNKQKCERAQREYKNALHLFPPSDSGWYPPVLTCSAVNNIGLEDIWHEIDKFANHMKGKGMFLSNRQYQNVEWMHDIILYSLKQNFYSNKSTINSISGLEKEIRDKHIPAISAARKLLNDYHDALK